jgi:hypothetical protein
LLACGGRPAEPVRVGSTCEPPLRGAQGGGSMTTLSTLPPRSTSLCASAVSRSGKRAATDRIRSDRDVVNVDVAARVGAEQFQGRLLMRGITHVDPQQKPTARRLLLDPADMMAVHDFAEYRADRSAAAGDHKSGQRAADAAERDGADQGEADGAV